MIEVKQSMAPIVACSVTGVTAKGSFTKTGKVRLPRGWKRQGGKILSPEALGFDLGKAIEEMRRVFSRTSRKWPVEKRKSLIQFWKQAAEEWNCERFLMGEINADLLPTDRPNQT